ncbi:MAG: nucleotidyltransferase family protein [Oscillospiraceae bacterium]
MNEMQIAKEYLKCLVASSINEVELPALPENVNINILYNLAMRNRVSVMLYLAFQGKKNDLPKEVFLSLEKSYSASMMREISQEEELKFIRKTFTENKIDFLLLKGSHLKKLYPSPAMRFMVDMDILVKKSDVARGKEIILSRGFSQEMNNGKDIVLIKKPFLTIELHNTLFVEEDSMHPYFLGVWDRAKCLENSEFAMTDNDLYVYVMAHLAEHYKDAGSCFRPMMDIYLLIKKCSDNLDFDYINAEFQKIGLLSFAEKIKVLAFSMFEGNEKDEVLNMMENYIVFGPPIKNANIASKNATNKQSKLKRIFSYAFPNFKHMSLVFPILTKCPYLLPIFYVVRAFNFLFKDKDFAKKKLASTVESNDKDTKIMEDIFKKSGL